MTVISKLPLWLDCDPGNDDVFAILLAAIHPVFELIGITTVHGNAPLSMTTHNALALLEILKFKQDSIKVYAGSELPLVKPAMFAPEMHGKLGIGGASFPNVTQIKQSTDVGYLEAMRDAILKYESEICIVCTGPLTNLSKLITIYPELKSKIKLLSIMGGGIKIGNITPYAEFNFHIDPHAASIVLSDNELSGKTILVPLNITHKAIANEDVRSRIYSVSNNNSRLRKLFHDILMFFSEAYKIKHGFTQGPPIHDPLAVFALLPILYRDDSYEFKYLKRVLRIVEEGEHEGEIQVINDNYDESVEEENGVYIGLDTNVERFWEYILEAVDIADKRTSNS